MPPPAAPAAPSSPDALLAHQSAAAHAAVAAALALDERGQYTLARPAYRDALAALQRALAAADDIARAGVAVGAADACAATAATLRQRLDRVRTRLSALDAASEAAVRRSSSFGAASASVVAPAAATAAAGGAAGGGSGGGSRPTVLGALVARQQQMQLQHQRSMGRPAPAAPAVRQAPRGVVPASARGGNAQPSAATPAPVDAALIATIEAEILDSSPGVSFDDISGMDDVKAALHEMIVLPVQRPDLYTGLRSPGKGILLFGPPGTGKTMAAKAVASSSNATFFSISASTLGSKYHGESEKLMKALFYVARQRQPSFIFIDEIDSMLGSRGEGEHEASRRLKTEFLVQFDGAAGSKDDAVYVVGATNRPQDLDDAVRRRLNKRIYVPLPDIRGRLTLLEKLTIGGSKDVKWDVSKHDLRNLAAKIEFYSGADIHALCREAALMPLRELGPRIAQVDASTVRAVSKADLDAARSTVKPSASRAQLLELENWDREFGSSRRPPSNSSGSSDFHGGSGGKPAGPRQKKAPSNQDLRQKNGGRNDRQFPDMTKALSSWRLGQG